MNLFDLQAKISLDTSGYEKDVQHAKNSFDGISAKAVAMGHLIANGVTTAGKALVNFGKMGMQYNSQMEEYTTNFKVMLGSTEQAAAKVEELKKMAAKTPFGMNELAEATQTLLSFQVPAGKSTDILRMLGDAALGNKEKMKSLALVFGQISSAGKLTGQDLMQFINQGFNPLNYIAQRTGESMEELRDRMSKGAISAEEVEQAFIDATSAGGQFYNGMEEASQTMSGLTSTLYDAVNSKLGEFFAGVSVKAKEALPDIIAFVENINVEEVKVKLQGLLDTFVNLTPIIVGATSAALAYKTAVAISEIIDSVRAATEAQTIAQAALNAVMNANPFVLITTLIIGLVTAFITLIATNENLRNKIVETWNFIKKKAIELFNWLKEKVTAIGDWVKSFPKKLYQIGVNMINSLWDGIKSVWNNLTSWFNNAWNSLTNRSVNVNVNGKSSSYAVNGSHANGLKYVPFDGYVAELHKGERVLTADEADNYNNKKNNGISIIQNIYSEAKTAADLMEEALYQQEKAVLLGV